MTVTAYNVGSLAAAGYLNDDPVFNADGNAEINFASLISADIGAIFPIAPPANFTVYWRCWIYTNAYTSNAQIYTAPIPKLNLGSMSASFRGGISWFGFWNYVQQVTPIFYFGTAFDNADYPGFPALPPSIGSAEIVAGFIQGTNQFQPELGQRLQLNLQSALPREVQYYCEYYACGANSQPAPVSYIAI